MANNKLEMVGQFIPGTTDYPVTIPDFVPNMTVVIYIKVTAVTDTYSQTTAVLASSDDYSFLLQGDGKYNIQFKSAVTSQYVAFVVRQPYTKPVSSWNDLVSNANINYIALNKENEQIYEDFYTQFDFQTDRVMTLETAYKWEEMKLIPYLDEEFIWLKRGGKIIGIHRTELIKEQLDEILGILAIMRNIQTDVTTKYADIIVKWNDIKTLAAQVLIWRNDTETFYNLSLTLKNQIEDLYADFETMADGKYNSLYNLYNDSITSINNTLNAGILTINNLADVKLSEMNTLINTGKNDITDLKNTALTQITTDTNSSLSAIEIAKNQAIQDIIDTAAEIIGGDFLIRGGTTYASAKAIEDDINELKNREGGDIIRVSYSIGTFLQEGGGDLQRYLKIKDGDNTEILTLDKTKKYIGVIDTDDTSGINYGNVVVLENGLPLQVLRPGKNSGVFTQSTINFSEFPQYSLQELYWNPKLENGVGSWSLNNSYLPFNNYTFGLFSKKNYADLKNNTSFINMNMGAYTDIQIITEMNKAYLNGQDAQINMFMSGSGITPTLSTDTNGRMTFTPISTTMVLNYIPKEIAGQALARAECRIPMLWDSVEQKYLMNTYFPLRTIGNWRFFGGKQTVFNGTISKNLSNGTTTQILNASELGVTFPIISVKAVTLIGTITTDRIETGNSTFPFNVRIFLASTTKEFPLLTYVTLLGLEQVIVSINSAVNINTQLQLVFALRLRSGVSVTSGLSTVKLEVVEFEYF